MVPPLKCKLSGGVFFFFFFFFFEESAKTSETFVVLWGLRALLKPYIIELMKVFNLYLKTLVFLALLTSPANAWQLEIYGAKTPGQLELLNLWGFDQVIIEDNALFLPAQDLGMGAVHANWWHKDHPMTYIVQNATLASLRPNLVSINMMDEPIYNDPVKHPPEFYQRVRRHLRQNGIRSPLSLTIYGPKPEWDGDQIDLFRGYLEAIDILRIDPYPVAGSRALRTVYDWSKAAQNFINDSGRHIKLTVILQAWADGDDPDTGLPKLPSVAQLRNMAYQAFFSGAQTVSFYSFDPSVWERYPGFLDGMRQVAAELRWLFRHYAHHFRASIDDEGVIAVRSLQPHLPGFLINTTAEQRQGLEPLEIQSN